MIKPEALPAGATIGILGGGQLGRMLALAAYRLGMKVHVFCPVADSPAFEVTPHTTIAAYEDKAALQCFAELVDVVTYEFENVPSSTAAFLASRKPLRPDAMALQVSQDRLAEKAFLRRIGVAVAPYHPVLSLADLEAGLVTIGTPALLKTTRLGYDGKGQVLVRTAAQGADAFAILAPKPLVLESFVPFSREISVVAARGLDGEIATFEPAENVHREGILRSSTVPARITPSLRAEAEAIAGKILIALDYVGVLGVEYFVRDDRSLLVNEIAPRVHNSGHWTEAVCAADQFEQHIRAIAGWPLGTPGRLADVVMENLIGPEISALDQVRAPVVRPHLYGKTSTRAGRKMGHLNHIGPKLGK